MWFLKKAFLLVTLVLTACSPPNVIVDMSVLPAVPTTAKIKQLAGKASNLHPSSCSVPCSVTVEEGSIYEVSFDAPGYYPAVVQFDWLMTGFNTEVSNWRYLSHTFGYPIDSKKRGQRQAGGRQFRKLHSIRNKPNTKEWGK